MCCTRLTENTGRKNRHLCTISQLCRAVSSQPRHVLRIGKKLLNSSIFSTCPYHMVNLWPTNSWDRLTSLRHPGKFQWVSRLGFIVALMSLNGGQPNFAPCFDISWAGILHIHFWGLLPRNGILPGAKFTLHPSLVFSYIGSVTRWHSSSKRQPNVAAWYKEWNYGTRWRRGVAVTSLGISVKLLYVGPG